jgi:phosphatidylserine/phosphatidylglycerophosphate/cardiolipin synthase-like enzyme
MKDNQDIPARKLIDRLVADDPARWGAMLSFLATTYELRPDFLEMDFLPSVFGLGAWDDRSWATRIALEKRLFELDAAVIFMEAGRYRGRPRSLRLDVRPTVSPPGAVLHAKVTLLVFERAVRLIVGSANLTKQGYRENREVIAVLTATTSSKKEAPLINQALVGMETALAAWLTPEAGKLIRRAREILLPWLNGNTDADNSFVWSNRQQPLWRAFIQRWPAGEPIKRVSIISPFWSQDASVTLSTLLGELKHTGGLAPGAEVRLLTDAFENPDGTLIPVLPPAYLTQDWNALGIVATAQPVSPKVHPEELGGMEGFTGTRALHAKVVLVEGTRTGLAYLGSANFTAHGWGFLSGGAPANTEAGLILRRSVRSPDLETLLPELVGQPLLLSNANVHAVRPPEIGPADEPWPDFIRQILLSPAADNPDLLQLRLEIASDSCALLWSARLLDKDNVPGETLLGVDRTKDFSGGVISVPLNPELLTRLLTDQEILIAWNACPAGRPYPLNVEPSARHNLPISPAKQVIEENHLLSYYQGRIAWEALFPDPEVGGDSHGETTIPAPVTGVDKSRIQSYQVREFVEALAGLNQDLKAATQSEPAMRLALLGPVSPVALAQTILDAASTGRRTPTAAAFQLVEILACLQSARSHPVPERLAGKWADLLAQATDKISRHLHLLQGNHAADFAANKAFSRYHQAILNGASARAS